QVLVVYQNAPMKQINMRDLTLTPIETEIGPAKLDLTLFLKPERDYVDGVLEYDRGAFLAETIDQMVQRYLWLLDTMVAEPDRRLGDLLPSESFEKSASLYAFNEGLN
ncbi:MAG: hypothetical protein ACRD4F_18840, partial [Candidatus Angelobacter sp.]